MKTFLEYINESIIDPPQKRLDPDIFEVDNPARLKQLVKSQIQRGIDILDTHAGITVLDYRLIGSILTHRYSPDSDLDINVLIEGDFTNSVKVATMISGRQIPGTKHVINYHVLNQRIVWETANRLADGVFNVAQNRFERLPVSKPFDLELYWKDFTRISGAIDQASIKLKKAVLDYDALKLAQPNQLRALRVLAARKLRDIKMIAQKLSDIYKIVRSRKDSIYTKEMSQEDVIRYGEVNRLPANVIYKLLEKYHYMKLLHSINRIIGNDATLSLDELRELRQIFNPTHPL